MLTLESIAYYALRIRKGFTQYAIRNTGFTLHQDAQTPAPLAQFRGGGVPATGAA